MIPSVLNLLQQNRCVIRFREINKLLIKMEYMEICFPKSCKFSGLVDKQTQVDGNSVFIPSNLLLVKQVKNIFSDNTLQ